jgi:hypothetical protein
LDEFLNDLKKIRKDAKPILDFRHKMIAHTDHDIAMGNNLAGNPDLSAAEEITRVTSDYLLKLSEHIFPQNTDGLTLYEEICHRKNAAKDLVVKIKKFNEDFSFEKPL